MEKYYVMGLSSGHVITLFISHIKHVSAVIMAKINSGIFLTNQEKPEPYVTVILTALLESRQALLLCFRLLFSSFYFSGNIILSNGAKWTLTGVMLPEEGKVKRCRPKLSKRMK